MAKKAPTRRRLANVPLEIEVRNFGPISKSRFRLRPLTVFVGSNNSGKTFAATLAHSVISARGVYEHPSDYVKWVRRELKGQRLKSLVSGMGKLVESASAAGTRMPTKYTDAVQELVHGHSFEKSMLGSISENFGTSLNRLVRIGQRTSTVKVKYHINSNVKIGVADPPAVKIGHMDIAYCIKREQGEVSIYEDAEKVCGRRIDPILIGNSVQDYIDTVSRHLKLKKGSGLYWLLHLMKRMEHASMYLPRSCYLPAARSGILSARDPIVSGIVKSSSYLGTGPPRGSIPRIVSDYLESLVQMGEFRPHTNGKNGQGVFKDLFGGSLEVQRPKIGLPQLVYKTKGVDVPLNLMSSAITETAPLQLFLQGKIPRADVLILEEPEAHLHPANQARLAKHIVRLVNSGVHVLLITHGVYFLEQLSMFVRMSKVSIEERKELGYSAGDFLKPDNVAPYIFKKDNSGGYVIQEMEGAPDDGISQDEFGRVTEIMYNKEIQIERMIGES